ncbi:VENN motif pre-toxin domain-containing protein [Pantoea vagans]|uniref:VENN motif pre-toxin domain-containing protein n=1 Tax=Pantoea vagans TaxID=470934 RepID=UPI00289B8F0C|nr:VENN motif pre-toxin domain-containing protein [Pantoea vagans]
MGAQMLANAASNSASTLLSGLNNKGHAEGTTQAAVANGTIIVRDQNRQTQDVSALSRDTEHANDSISAIFDKEKEQKRLQTAQLAGEISGQMTNIVTTMGDIKGLEKAQSAKNAETLPAGATEKRRGEWLEKMRDSPEYQAEMKQWGIGSTSQKVAQTVGSILTGLVTGNAGQAVAGGLNPWAAQLIKKETTDASGNVDVATNAMAHAVWGAVSAQMSGGSAAAGAAGAFSGELATRYIAEKYWGADTPEKIAALGQEDREQLSLLGTLAAGLAGGMVGNSSAAATSGAIAGKNAVENNSLSGDKARQSVKESAEWWKKQVRDKLGDGTTSAIANSIINAVADTGDAALGRTDYVADGAMALASCAVGDGYCNKALSDLAGKNQAVADAVKTLMKSETWSAVADTLKQASGGNQAALEATGGILASILSPGSKVPEFGAVLGKTEKLVKNADGIYEVKVNVTPLEGHDRLNTPDLGGNGKLKPAEAASAAQLEPVLGTMERYTPPPGMITDKTPDFVITSGPNKGKSVDAMYTTDRLSQKEIDGLNKFYEKNMISGNGQKVIQDHLQKADFVPVDFRVLTSVNQNVFMNYIKTLPKAQQDKIIIMR